MLQFTSHVGPWALDVWEDAAGNKTSEDDSLFQIREKFFRIAVLDGLTPTDNTPSLVGVSGAAWAANVARAALKGPGDLEECTLLANAQLFPMAEGRDCPQAMLLGADIYPTGEALLLRAGDVKAWALREDGWDELFPEHKLTPKAREEYVTWFLEHPEHNQAEFKEAEDEILGSVTAWRSTPLGRFAEPTCERRSLASFDQLVLATAGARLSIEKMDNLDNWLVSIRDWERRTAPQLGARPHQDITVIRLRRQEAPDGPGQLVSLAEVEHDLTILSHELAPEQETLAAQTPLEEVAQAPDSASSETE